MTKTYKTARQVYILPNMKEELLKAVDGCKYCLEDQPTQARPKLSGLLPSASVQPMLHIATDLFELQGDTYIILVDQYSGYAWTVKLPRKDTRSICESLTHWFMEYGWPSYIGTEGRPQFRG